MGTGKGGMFFGRIERILKQLDVGGLQCLEYLDEVSAASSSFDQVSMNSTHRLEICFL